MALDEYVFGRVANYFRKRKQDALEEAGRAVSLEEIKPRLTILARALSGKAIELFPAEREGGYKNNNFFLPATFALLPTREANLSFYYFRLLYLHVQQQMDLNWKNDEGQSVEISRAKAAETAPEILEMLFNQYPLAKEIVEAIERDFPVQDKHGETQATWMYGKWMYNIPDIASENVLKEISDKVRSGHEEKIKTILKAKAVEQVKTLEVDKKQQEDYVLTHNFEKVETADEFSGVWRDFDGDDELKDHQDALDELSMSMTVRVDDPVHSVFQADFVENTTVSESAEMDSKGFHLLYDEWNYLNRTYKPDYCKVYPLTQLKIDAEYFGKTMKEFASTLTGLRKLLATVNNKQQQQRRQVQGNEFDLDAVIDLFADVKARRTPSDTIYLSDRKREKDLSILLLLDISLSSDSYAAGNRVIDVEKQVSLLFGEILNEFEIDFSINSFYSKTRNHATYITLKGFDEPWSSTRHRIGAAEPQGYTRIGAALRHSGAMLEKRQTKNKWVILLSDGKPNDFDRYEGKYGIQDVKQALRELKERQINSYALAIEAQAKYYLPQMFGQNHYQILTTPVEMLAAMVKLFEKIKHLA